MSEPAMNRNAQRARNAERLTAKTPDTFNAIFTLACGHTVRHPPPYPREGELWHCAKCNTLEVVTVVPLEWSVRCRNCSYARQYGVAPLTASHGASAHLKRKPAHTVDIYEGDTLRETRKRQEQAQLFDTTVTQELPDEPPF